MSKPAQNGRIYADSGVDYATLDAGKRSAVDVAFGTSALLAARGGSVFDASRGEPAFVFSFGGRTYAFVLEGLGTKSIIAREVEKSLGASVFANVAYDTVAAIVNDLCCVGALPLVVNAYFATGSSDWYVNRDRADALLQGWRRACNDAGSTWGGGESPMLPELVSTQDIELAGAAVGVTADGREPILGEALTAGNEIVFIASSGLHANGASLARMVADDVLTDRRYDTVMADGRTFGEALLEPTIMYAGLVKSLLGAEVPVTYLSHITGHGFLKLMRPLRPLTYRITDLLPVPPVLEFLVESAEMSPQAAYSTFNMGVGYAVYCERGTGASVVEIARGLGLEARVAGHVETGPRQVIVEPLSLTFQSGEMVLGSSPVKPSAASSTSGKRPRPER